MTTSFFMILLLYT